MLPLHRSITMNNLLRAASASLALLFLVGCGQSGPLFVPGNPSTVEPQPQQQQPAQEEDEDDENGAASP